MDRMKRLQDALQTSLNLLIVTYINESYVFWPDMPVESVQTKIRLLPEEHFDHGRHFLLFHQHLLEALLHCRTSQIRLQLVYSKVIIAPL